ncbi:winged helix-turn-helix domain-containing protein [Protofrankia coriariae]|uniref:Transcriptional regulator n=1 Tax=Protofrankia coriariae TaxID=1562887 RepID=A0ABR5F1A8_9ACTN|nr:winged helix-turn-helix domain-containing protein [Protofrankia coriariae]KLL10508.1 transcriptional regulator [Protofrankia coriariae]
MTAPRPGSSHLEQPRLTVTQRRRLDTLTTARATVATPLRQQPERDVVVLGRAASWQQPTVQPPAGSPIIAPAGAPTTTPQRPERGVWIDRPTWSAFVDGKLLDLTYLEFELLDFLVRHPALVHSRTALLRSVWGYNLDDDPRAAGRTVDVHITRLRRKLGPEHRDRIETIRRVGYRYRPVSTGRQA